MRIQVLLGDYDFDLDIDITTHLNCRIEFAFPSALEFPFRVNFKEWKSWGSEEKNWVNGAIMKANQLKHNIYSEEDRQIILESIESEILLD